MVADRVVRRRWLVLGAMAVLAVASVVGCAPDNTKYQVIDNIPYHPVSAADLVVDDWGDLENLALQSPAVPGRIVDVHFADPDDPPVDAPVIIRIPGGAWVHHNQNTLPVALERYVEQGWVVVTVGYTVANATQPAKQWPVQGQEIDWVVRWVRANATALGIDPERVVLLGDSAGAHLAAHVASGEFATNTLLPAPAGGDDALSLKSSHPDALVLLSGAFDVSKDGVPQDPGIPASTIPPYWPQEPLIGCNPGVTPLPSFCAGRISSASVVHPGVTETDLANFPPTFLAHAANDPVVPFGPNSFQLAAQICNTVYPGNHRITTWLELLEGSTDHQVAALDWGKVDYFLYRQGLLPAKPVATPDWVCNQP